MKNVAGSLDSSSSSLSSSPPPARPPNPPKPPAEGPAAADEAELRSRKPVTRGAWFERIGFEGVAEREVELRVRARAAEGQREVLLR